MDSQHNIVNVDKVIRYFKSLQSDCCSVLEILDGKAWFKKEQWTHKNGGGGRSHVIENGSVFEKAGVNFSHVKGGKLPKSASLTRPDLSDKPFEATGVSIVIHPDNPFIPTTHMNVRFFLSDPDSSSPVWWFGGGYDLSPYYGFEEDCIHWHDTAKTACETLGKNYYRDFKHRCDEYFFLKHRNEPRGIGGIFFDDLNSPGFDKTFEFVRTVGGSFLNAYTPIVEKRKSLEFNERHKKFQRYRRGRYVEFNLVYDRGTLFGLQSGGRTESILMSLPPQVEWKYNWKAEPGSDEEKLTDYYLQPKDWAGRKASTE